MEYPSPMALLTSRSMGWSISSLPMKVTARITMLMMAFPLSGRSLREEINLEVRDIFDNLDPLLIFIEMKRWKIKKIELLLKIN